MKLDLNNITFVIVTYQSENIVKNCLDSLPKDSKKIIVENSNNINLKNDLELKYDNIEVILNENLGMGASNNIGIKKSNTDYVYILNPDVLFKKDTFLILEEEVKKIEDFSIISPTHYNKNFPNYKNPKKVDENIIEVDSVDGYSMLIKKKNFNNDFFDENFFLYLENDDLCLRSKKRNEKIYVIKNSYIEHLGASSSFHKEKEFDYLRNWHWMWSKFYFNKKHFGYLNAIFKTIANLISAKVKFLFYLIILNKHKRKVYQMRISGLINSMIGKKSYFRLKN